MACALFGIAGTALAVWTNPPGSGAGSGETGTAQPVTILPGTPTARLYPGGTANVMLSLDNPNDFAVTLTSLSLDNLQGTGGFGVDGGHLGCSPLSALSYTPQTNGGVGWVVPSGGSTLTLTNALSMTAGAANACQGATFTVYVTDGPGPTVLYRVNAGGSLLAVDGPDWTTDSGFVGGAPFTAEWPIPALDGTVPAGTPAQMFGSERWGLSSWNFAVTSGKSLTVRLYFANGYAGTSQPGQRVFNVSSDGVDIDLTAVTENPLINGIEILENAP
jgi:hypothetical protein